MDKKTDERVREIAEILWRFHNDRLADPSINEMKPYIQPILDIITKEKIQARIEALEAVLDNTHDMSMRDTRNIHTEISTLKAELK